MLPPELQNFAVLKEENSVAALLQQHDTTRRCSFYCDAQKDLQNISQHIYE
jgi:hypothetical protein